MTNWLIFALVAGASSVVFNLFNRRTLSRGVDSTVYAWLFELIRALFFLSLIPFDSYLLFSWQNIFLLVSLGASELIGVYLYMKMHAHTELSVSSILSRLRVILVPLAAFFFLGERLQPVQYLGILIIFFGCLAIAGNGQIRSTKGFRYAISFILVNTISNLLMKSATAIASNSVVNAFYSVPAALFIPVLMKSTRLRLPAAKSFFRPTLIASIFNIITMFSLVSAYKLAPAGQVNSTFQGISSLAVIIGIIFLHEHKHLPLKLTGVALTTIGIVLLV